MKLTQEDDGLDHHLCRIVDRYLNISIVSIVTVLSLRHAKLNDNHKTDQTIIRIDDQ